MDFPKKALQIYDKLGTGSNRDIDWIEKNLRLVWNEALEQSEKACEEHYSGLGTMKIRDLKVKA